MKVGDLVELKGMSSPGLITGIKKLKFPPYNVFYKIHWQGGKFCWVKKCDWGADIKKLKEKAVC